MAAGKCKAAYHTDEFHGYGCNITEGACMFLYPDSKNALKNTARGQMQKAREKARKNEKRDEYK